MSLEIKKMIDEFQCPGCANGSDTESGCYSLREDIHTCDNHVPGTIVTPGGLVCLGLPKGFNRVGEGKLWIRMYPKGSQQTHPYNDLNVPVWAIKQDRFLFVRVYMPRINATAVDIFEDGKLFDIAPDAINVAEFYSEID